MSKRLIAASAVVIVAVVLIATTALSGVRLPAPKIETTPSGDIVPFDHPDIRRGSRVATTDIGTIDERSFRVSFNAAVKNSRSCERYYPIVVEDDEFVMFTIATDPIENAPWFDCNIDPGMHETQTMVIDLQQPLGERQIIDVATRPLNDDGDELPVDYLNWSTPLQWESYDVVDATTIRLTAKRSISGPWATCQRHEVQVEYTDEEITLALQEGPIPFAEQLCQAGRGDVILGSFMQEPFTLLVELDEPIKDRQIIDAAQHTSR